MEAHRVPYNGGHPQKNDHLPYPQAYSSQPNENDFRPPTQTFSAPVALNQWRTSTSVSFPSGNYNDPAFPYERPPDMGISPPLPPQPLPFPGQQFGSSYSPTSPDPERYQHTLVSPQSQHRAPVFGGAYLEPPQKRFLAAGEQTNNGHVSRHDDNQRIPTSSYSTPRYEYRPEADSYPTNSPQTHQRNNYHTNIQQTDSYLPVQHIAELDSTQLCPPNFEPQVVRSKSTTHAGSSQLPNREAENLRSSTTSPLPSHHYSRASVGASQRENANVFELGTESLKSKSCISPLSTPLSSSPNLSQPSRISSRLDQNEPVELEDPAQPTQPTPSQQSYHQSQNAIHLNPHEAFELGYESPSAARVAAASGVLPSHSSRETPFSDMPLALSRKTMIEQIVDQIDALLEDDNRQLPIHINETRRMKIEELLLDILTKKTNIDIESIRDAPSKVTYERDSNRLLRAIDKLRGSTDFKDSLRALTYGRIGSEAFWLSTIGYKGDEDTVECNKKLIDDIRLLKSEQEKSQLREWIRTIRPDYDVLLDELVPNGSERHDADSRLRLERDKNTLKDILDKLKITNESLSPQAPGRSKLLRLKSKIGRGSTGCRRRHLAEEAVLIRRFMNILIRRHWIQVSGEEIRNSEWASFAGEFIETFESRLSIEDKDLVKLCRKLLY